MMKILNPMSVESRHGTLGENFDFHTHRETLAHIKVGMARCIEWIDLSQGPHDVGSKPSPMGVELKPNSEDFIPSKAPIVMRISGPLPMDHSSQDSKDKAPMGSGGALAKFSF